MPAAQATVGVPCVCTASAMAAWFSAICKAHLTSAGRTLRGAASTAWESAVQLAALPPQEQRHGAAAP